MKLKTIYIKEESNPNVVYDVYDSDNAIFTGTLVKAVKTYGYIYAGIRIETSCTNLKDAKGWVMAYHTDMNDGYTDVA